EAALEARLRDPGDRLGRLAAGIEGDERLARLPVPDELEAPEEPEPPHLADARMALCEPRERLAEVVAHRGGVLDHALLAEGLDRRDTRRAGKRMARVGEPAGEVPVLDRVVDVVA